MRVLTVCQIYVGEFIQGIYLFALKCTSTKLKLQSCC